MRMTPPPPPPKGWPGGGGSRGGVLLFASRGNGFEAVRNRVKIVNLKIVRYLGVS
jgi:hypothetical protein